MLFATKSGMVIFVHLQKEVDFLPIRLQFLSNLVNRAGTNAIK